MDLNDVQMKNVHGKEDTIVTVQIDQMLAELLTWSILTLTEQSAVRIIHRTSLGCYERTLALLIEKYAGALPLWISPEQIKFFCYR